MEEEKNELVVQEVQEVLEQKQEVVEAQHRLGQPLKFPSVELLQQGIEDYFAKCDAAVKTVMDKYGEMHEVSDPIPYTMSGLAVALGCDRTTLVNYSHKEAYFNTIKEAKARVEAQNEVRLFNKFTPGVIFSLKNNYNWKDKIEIDQNQNMTIQVSPQKAFTEDD